jgi:adenine/guanine phosphoribosyltransferase-like PRPP-binding protein
MVFGAREAPLGSTDKMQHVGHMIGRENIPNDKFCATSYLEKVLNPIKRNRTVAKLIEKIYDSKIQFDAIAVRGISGVSIGTVIAYEFDKPLIIVRKTGDKTHSDRKTEGIVDFNTYIIIDDCIDSGDTMQQIYNDVKAHINCHKYRVGWKTNDYSEDGNTFKYPKLVGIFIWNDGTKNTWEIIREKRHLPVFEKINIKNVYGLQCD